MAIYTKGDTISVTDGGYIRIFMGQGIIKLGDSNNDPIYINVEEVIEKGVCFLGPHGYDAEVISGWVDMVASATATLALRTIPGNEAQQLRVQGGSRENSSTETITLVSGVGKLKIEILYDDDDKKDETYFLDLKNAHLPFNIDPNDSGVTTKFSVLGENSWIGYSA